MPIDQLQTEVLAKLSKKKDALELNLKNEKQEREKMNQKMQQVRRAHQVDISNVKTKVKVNLEELFERKLDAMQECFNKETEHVY